MKKNKILIKFLTGWESSCNVNNVIKRASLSYSDLLFTNSVTANDPCKLFKENIFTDVFSFVNIQQWLDLILNLPGSVMCPLATYKSTALGSGRVVRLPYLVWLSCGIETFWTHACIPLCFPA